MIFSLVCFLSFNLVYAAQEFETIVKETKFNSSSRVIIDKEEIEKSRVKNVTTLLATQANINIIPSNFTPSSIFLRGGDSGHILILVDGIPFYDSATLQRTSNLNDFDIKSIQRIEIIKGSQSVLYGGQALAGVIKIDTIPRDLKGTGQILLQRGDYKQNLIAAGGFIPTGENSGIIARGSFSDKRAISPDKNSEKLYPTSLSTGELGFVYKSAIETTLKTQTSFNRTFISTTETTSFAAADANNFISSTYQLSGTGRFYAPTWFLEPDLVVSSQRAARQFEQDFLSSGGSPTKQDYLADLNAVRLETMPFDGDIFKLKIGGSYNNEKMIYRDLDIQKSDVGDEYEGLFAKSEIFFSENIFHLRQIFPRQVKSLAHAIFQTHLQSH